MRTGIVEVTDRLYTVNYDAVSPLFSVFRPIYVRYLVHKNKWQIYGVCADFEEVIEGAKPPHYSFSITSKGVKFEKKL